MSSLVLVGGFYGLGLWVLFHRWRTGRSAPQFVAGLFPTALLFVTLPIPLGGWALVQGFQRIAQQGVGGVREVATFCLPIARGSLLATVGFLTAVAITATLQLFAMDVDSQTPRLDHGPESGLGLWRRVILFASTLLVVPVGLLSYVTQGTVRLIMRSAVVPGALVTADTMRETSETISRQALLAIVSGGGLTVLLGIFAITNVAAAWSGTASDSLRRYFWAVLVIVSVWAVWDLAQLIGDVNAFQRALR
jgi:hypothetical protein